MINYPITEAEFRTWLKVHRDDVVGVTVKPWACPVRNCLGDLRGEPEVEVATDATYFGGGNRAFVCVTNPEWVRQFVTKLDNDAQGMVLEVTGEEALKFLDDSAETQGERYVDANGG